MTDADPDPDRAAESPRQRLERLAAACAARGSDPGLAPAASALSSPLVERMFDLSRSMVRIHDRERLLGFVCDGLRELFDAQNSFVVMFDESGAARVHQAHTAGPPSEASPVSATILEAVRRSCAPMIIEDTSAHPDLRDRRSIELLRIASVLCAPLVVDERVIGVLQFDHRGASHPFPLDDLKLLGLFADQVATAFHNLELIERLNDALRETREAQLRVVAAERLAALGELAACIAHDFNNTLFVAAGQCELLLEEPDLPGQARERINRVHTCALDAARTVERLQVFGRELPADPGTSPADPAAAAREVSELVSTRFRARGGEQGLHVRLDLAEGLTVRGAAADLREILLNLVINAAEAQDGVGTVSVRVRREEDVAVVQVVDQGGGIEEAVRQRIFEPFFTTKKGRGRGLGLAASWSLSRQLGGDLFCVSEPGRGSTFELRLPLALPLPESETLPAVRRGSASRVLVIDDDGEVVELLGRMLAECGFQGEVHTDAAAAVARLDEARFDLVLTDLAMGETNGVDVARSIRSAHPGLPVVLLTGWGAVGQLTAEERALFRETIRKPLRLANLRSALARALTTGESPANPGGTACAP